VDSGLFIFAYFVFGDQSGKTLNIPQFGKIAQYWLIFGHIFTL